MEFYLHACFVALWCGVEHRNNFTCIFTVVLGFIHVWVSARIQDILLWCPWLQDDALVIYTFVSNYITWCKSCKYDIMVY
jgi:hypothetical protein